MAYDNRQLNRIFDRTDERCHLCGEPLRFEAYGFVQHHRGWEVDHDRPRARGGSDSLRNLLPAHVRCNRSKQARSSRAVRAEMGLSARPLSSLERRRARARAAVELAAWTGLIAGVAGALTAPPGEDALRRAARWAMVGAVGGGLVGAAADPEARS